MTEAQEPKTIPVPLHADHLQMAGTWNGEHPPFVWKASADLIHGKVWHLNSSVSHIWDLVLKNMKARCDHRSEVQ